MYNIKWRKVKQARSYSNVSKRCNLCLWEKYFIICKPEMSTLNNRSELISTCRHSKKFLLNTVLAQISQSSPSTSRHQVLFCVFKFCIYSHVSVIFGSCLMIASQEASETLSSNKCLRPNNPTLQIYILLQFIY